jgi:hypothetical protein
MSTVPKLIFIVPYRDRERQKHHFSIYMKYIMEDYNKDDYEIYYSHQTDSRMFNRGATKNIGFLVMKEKYPNDYKNITFVFNDVDTLPTIKNIFDYVTYPGTVKHFYGFTFALGGIVSINGGDFEKCNGFPNNWGWGLEDNALNDRVLQQSLSINRDQFLPFNSKNIIHLYDEPTRVVNTREPLAYVNNNLIDNLNNISNLYYSIVHNNIQEDIDKISNVTENTNKISTIKQNEYVINILNFQTLIPSASTYYKQNMLETTVLNAYKSSILIKRNVKPRWLLTKTFNKLN